MTTHTVIDADTGNFVDISDGGGGGGSGGLTDAELRASDVKVSLDGESVTVTGPITDTQLRASDVKISLDNEVVTVSGVIVTGGLTDTQLRASAVTISGVVTTGGLTDTQLRATNVGVVPHGLAIQVDATPTLTVASGYVTGDYVGTSTTPITFSGCAATNGGTGTIVGALLVDGAKQSIAGELWLFDTAPTAPNDSAAWAITDSEATKCVGIIPFGDAAHPYYASANNSVCPVGGLSIIFKTLVSSQNLYGCLVTRGSPSYANGDLTVRLRVWQD
jgi:hypothetical protein